MYELQGEERQRVKETGTGRNRKFTVKRKKESKEERSRGGNDGRMDRDKGRKESNEKVNKVPVRQRANRVRNM